MKVVTNLINSIEKDLKAADKYNVHEDVIALIDYFKEEASNMVIKMTKKWPKQKLLNF